MNVNSLRLEQIDEALAGLEAVFADPGCFHSPGSRDQRPVQDYALSLASEFVGAYREDEITRAPRQACSSGGCRVPEGGS